jgi:uncharacterized protein
MRILIIPGWQNSGPEHWQTLWEQAHPEYQRVEQRDWDRPNRDAWIAALDTAIAAVGASVGLVSHSLGGLVVAHWVARAEPAQVARVRAALLVAPPSPEGIAAVPEIVGFLPVPRARLPFPSILVASADDPSCAFARAEEYASAWGGRLVNIGAHGHINTDAGFGPWPAGEALLAELLATSNSVQC